MQAADQRGGVIADDPARRNPSARLVLVFRRREVSENLILYGSGLPRAGASPGGATDLLPEK